jgi:GNAT superfamily N-acetyltransferase
MEKEIFKIRNANNCDAKAISKISNHNLIANQKEKFLEEFEKKGFLMTGYCAEFIEKNILNQQDQITLVAETKSEIIGYLTGQNLFSLEEVLQKNLVQILTDLNYSFKNKIFYYRQIAKISDQKNIGKNLLLAMLEKAKEMGYDLIICKIVTAPFFNQASINFHEKFGFEKITKEFDSKKEVEFSIYQKLL